MKRNRRKIGAEFEEKTAEYLKQKGHQILQMNYRTRMGEIDLITRQGDTLVFVEVKSLLASMDFAPSERVDAAKQARIRKVALQYLIESNQYETCPVRFDVVSWQRTENGIDVQHFINAF